MTPAYKAFIDQGSLTPAVYGERKATPTDHRRARAAIDSEDDLICMEGCVFLLAHLDREMMPKLAVVIERLSTADEVVRDNVLLAMGALPWRAYCEYPGLAQFACVSARDPEMALNAALLVGELAAWGHPEATQVFLELQQGSDQDSRQNAIVSFEGIKKAERSANLKLGHERKTNDSV